MSTKKDYIDLSYVQSDFLIGVDEVGRGPLAGPVVSCACFVDLRRVQDITQLFDSLREMNITDSKKITAKKRKTIISNLISVDLKKNKILSFNSSEFEPLKFVINEVSHTRIDKINILNASLESMGNTLGHSMDYIESGCGIALIDGNKLPSFNDERLELEAIVKGDSKSVMIGLASVIAKEYRDNLMLRLSKKYPGYGLEGHAGYPTQKHKQAIADLGVTRIHRKSFKGVKEFLI